VLFLILAVLTMDYVGRFITTRADRKRGFVTQGKCGRGWWRWTALPALFAFIISVTLWSWPLRLRFQWSRPEFEQAVQKIQAGTDPQLLHGEFGSYRVKYIHVHASGAVFFQTGISGFDLVGIAYRPDDAPRGPCETKLAPFWFTEMW
jgi:hypothetical protein